MNIFRAVFSKKYRKHRWASKHLAYYRKQWMWLYMRRLHRLPLIMARLIEGCFKVEVGKGKVIIIPKFSYISSKKESLNG